jgi:hypothetical protein
MEGNSYVPGVSFLRNGPVNGAAGTIASYGYTLEAAGHRTSVTEHRLALPWRAHQSELAQNLRSSI